MPDDDDDDDLYGALVQSVARQLVTLEVRGSIPLRTAPWGGSSAGQNTRLSIGKSRVRTPSAPPV